MSGSQDQKERKTASTVTTIFLEQKITSAQIRFCNDRWPSRLVEWTNNEHIKITLLATHSPKKWKKKMYHKKSLEGLTHKKTYLTLPNRDYVTFTVR